MNKLFYLLGIVFLTLFSCNSKLTNEEAQKIISEEYPTFCSIKDNDSYGNGPVETAAFIYANGRNPSFQYDRLKLFKSMEAQGFIKINIKKTGFTDNPDLIYTWVLSDELAEKYNNEIAFTTNEFVSISGISQTDKTAIVKYKLKSIKTPLYPLLKQRKKMKCYETEWEEEVELIKYDTGWQIK